MQTFEQDVVEVEHAAPALLELVGPVCERDLIACAVAYPPGVLRSLEIVLGCDAASLGPVDLRGDPYDLVVSRRRARSLENVANEPQLRVEDDRQGSSRSRARRRQLRQGDRVEGPRRHRSGESEAVQAECAVRRRRVG